jgi:hypothetical protein
MFFGHTPHSQAQRDGHNSINNFLWLQESMALDGVGSFAEKIESICESILDHMWLKPVYDA